MARARYFRLKKRSLQAQPRSALSTPTASNRSPMHVREPLRQRRNDDFVASTRALKVVGWHSGALPESGSEADLFKARHRFDRSSWGRAVFDDWNKLIVASQGFDLPFEGRN
jgi:hypothetical protein